MRAGQLVGPRTMQLVNIPEPTVQDGEILVRIQKVSICGSDLRTFSTVLPEEQYPMSPGKPAHECVGIVEESPSDEFCTGQRVIVFPYAQGGLREYIAVPPNGLVAIPNEGSLDTWIMCQPMGTVLYSISRMGDLIGKNVVVLGQGAIGLSFTTFLSGMNLRELIVTDLEDYRLDLARSLGASHTINPCRDDVMEAVKSLTDGQGPDIVVEAAGEHETVRQSVELPRSFGTVIWFGLTYDEYFPIDFKHVRDKDLTMVSTASARTGMMPIYVRQAVHMVNQGRLDPSFMVTHRMKLAEIQTALTMYEARSEGIVKVVLDV